MKNEAGEEKLALNVMTYTDPPGNVQYGVNGCYDPPRQLLAAIPSLTFKELYRRREYALCCGGGGGVPDSFPEMAQGTTRHRLDEVLDIGADVIATSCPRCEKQFDRTLADPRSTDNTNPYDTLAVADVIELVYQSAGLKE
jgi:Fe-S oxidoreductase